jgi:DNA-binding response OmpR family regulator
LSRRFWSSRPLSLDAFEATRDIARACAAGGHGAPAPAKIRCGDVEVDRVERRGLLAGCDLHLTGREFALLDCLAERANRVVPRADLLSRIWTLPDDYGSNVVDVYVRRLRQKLGACAAMLETIRGFGYCLRPLDGA